MKRNLTPAQAYKRIVKKAKAVKLSPSAYAEKCGLTRSHIAKWKKKTIGSVEIKYAVKLGII